MLKAAKQKPLENVWELNNCVNKRLPVWDKNSPRRGDLIKKILLSKACSNRLKMSKRADGASDL